MAVGGGTKCDLWPQIVSDILQQPQEIPTETIGAAYGDALLAGIAAGLVDPATRWSSTAGVVEPPSPESDTPISLMTTAAPAEASATAIARPMPPPAPVTSATLPSSM